MSGGLLAPMAQIMMARAAGKHMARVIGYAAVPVLIAPILGPEIAGAILQYASWRWLFFINLPVGILAVVLAVLLLPSDREERRPRDLDLVGLAPLSPGLVLFLYGSDHLGERMGLVALIVSIVLLATFFRTATNKGDSALIDLRLFKGKVFSASVITQFMANGTSFAGQMLIPVSLIRACGRSPSAYASVKRQDLPMATTALNIVQRLGGPTLTTLCATFLGWRLASAHTDDSLLGAFTAAFLLLCVLHALLFAVAMRLPLSIGGATKRPLEAPERLESITE